MLYDNKQVEGGGEGRPGEHVCGMSDDPSNHIGSVITEVFCKGLVNLDFQLQPVKNTPVIYSSDALNMFRNKNN
jgi:hypothetical protein